MLTDTRTDRQKEITIAYPEHSHRDMKERLLKATLSQINKQTNPEDGSGELITGHLENCIWLSP